ncbi:hypothetical protein SKAU_G00359310 [Synaphobranchus kaupii]|uniref:Uncharacterized protein n=1 Tax=Synaphobranchus kaupii TaxID=118154 RepID=A0A9Q1EI16_SYNKA|nr:hypothetical protein SKAU_G00359310 [Synaphobranchus kaupii]
MVIEDTHVAVAYKPLRNRLRETKQTGRYTSPHGTKGDLGARRSVSSHSLGCYPYATPGLGVQITPSLG